MCEVQPRRTWEAEEPTAETERKGQKSKSVDAVFVNNSLGPGRQTQAAAFVLAECVDFWAIRTWAIPNLLPRGHRGLAKLTGEMMGMKERGSWLGSPSSQRPSPSPAYSQDLRSSNNMPE